MLNANAIEICICECLCQDPHLLGNLQLVNRSFPLSNIIYCSRDIVVFLQSDAALPREVLRQLCKFLPENLPQFENFRQKICPSLKIFARKIRPSLEDRNSS